MGACCAAPKPKPSPIVIKYDNEEEEEEEEKQKSYFSFSIFILENENPQIYEWQFKKEIGKGAMSRVFLAKNTETGEFSAAKVYNRTQLIKQTLGNEEPPILAVHREIEIMAKLVHRYILTIIEVIEDDFTNSLIMFMPYAGNGTLQTQLDKKTIDDAGLAICFHQIAEGLRYLHSKKIVHRDIKPENILAFSDEYFVLSDFSVSTELADDDLKLEDTKGSPAFLSPEECSGESYYPKPADVWAYGVSLYSAYFGKLPFNLDAGQGCTIANTVLVVTEMLQTQELTFPEDAKIDPSLEKLLRDTLQKDPMVRPTFEQIVKYEWFKDAWEIDQKLQEEEKENFEEEEDVGNVAENP